jgi:vanillate O-demethylase monooxygenase subunit
MKAKSMFLYNVWYAAVWAHELKAGELLPKTIIGEPLVFFRKSDGDAAALLNICPHKFAPLHMGKLLPGDKVQCGYHGLEFDSNGACVHNPHKSGRIAANCKVKPYEVLERHGMVWIWMGDEKADPATIPDYSFLDEDSGYDVTRKESIRVDANYRLVADNLLDLSHSPFLHNGVIGGPDTIQADISVTQDGNTVRVMRPKFNVRPPGLLNRLFKKDGEPVDIWSIQRWTPPCYLLNDTGAYSPGGDPKDGAALLGAHLLTPETENTTHYHFAASRYGKIFDQNEDQEEFKDWLATARRHAFEQEDEPMVKAQFEMIQNFPEYTSQPVLLEIDAGPVRCNRILDELIRRESESRDQASNKKNDTKIVSIKKQEVK